MGKVWRARPCKRAQEAWKFGIWLVRGLKNGWEPTFNQSSQSLRHKDFRQQTTRKHRLCVHNLRLQLADATSPGADDRLTRGQDPLKTKPQIGEAIATFAALLFFVRMAHGFLMQEGLCVVDHL